MNTTQGTNAFKGAFAPGTADPINYVSDRTGHKDEDRSPANYIPFGNWKINYFVERRPVNDSFSQVMFPAKPRITTYRRDCDRELAFYHPLYRLCNGVRETKKFQFVSHSHYDGVKANFIRYEEMGCLPEHRGPEYHHAAHVGAYVNLKTDKFKKMDDLFPNKQKAEDPAPKKGMWKFEIPAGLVILLIIYITLVGFTIGAFVTALFFN